MCTKWFSDGDVHKYFNPYNTPYEAYINFMNILSDLMIRLDDMHPVNYVERVEQPEPMAEPVVEKSVKKKASAKRTTAKTTKTTKVAKAKAVKTSIRDVLKINKTGLQKLLKDIDVITVYYALADADKKVKKSLVTHLGKLQLKEYNKLLSEDTPVSSADITKAQKAIQARIKKLAK